MASFVVVDGIGVSGLAERAFNFDLQILYCKQMTPDENA
jgi:hypothetical protein